MQRSKWLVAPLFRQPGLFLRYASSSIDKWATIIDPMAFNEANPAPMANLGRFEGRTTCLSFGPSYSSRYVLIFPSSLVLRLLFTFFLPTTASGKWTNSAKSKPIPDPLNGDLFAHVPIPEGQELQPFIDGLRSCPKSGLHNMFKNPER